MFPSDLSLPGGFAEWHVFAFNPCNFLSLESSELEGIHGDDSGIKTRSKRDLQNTLWSEAEQDVRILEVEGVPIRAPPASVVPHNSQLSQAFSRAARIVIVGAADWYSTRGICSLVLGSPAASPDSPSSDTPRF